MKPLHIDRPAGVEAGVRIFRGHPPTDDVGCLIFCTMRLAYLPNWAIAPTR